MGELRHGSERAVGGGKMDENIEDEKKKQMSDFKDTNEKRKQDNIVLIDMTLMSLYINFFVCVNSAREGLNSEKMISKNKNCGLCLVFCSLKSSATAAAVVQVGRNNGQWPKKMYDDGDNQQQQQRKKILFSLSGKKAGLEKMDLLVLFFKYHQYETHMGPGRAPKRHILHSWLSIFLSVFKLFLCTESFRIVLFLSRNCDNNLVM